MPTIPPHNGRANTGPVDFLHLLKRRRVSFERWAENEGIRSQDAFKAWREGVEAHGEFFISPELAALALTLPVTLTSPVTVEPVAEEPTEETDSQEEPSPTGSKRKRKPV